VNIALYDEHTAQSTDPRVIRALRKCPKCCACLSGDCTHVHKLHDGQSRTMVPCARLINVHHDHSELRKQYLLTTHPQANDKTTSTPLSLDITQHTYCRSSSYLLHTGVVTKCAKKKTGNCIEKLRISRPLTANTRHLTFSVARYFVTKICFAYKAEDNNTIDLFFAFINQP